MSRIKSTLYMESYYNIRKGKTVQDPDGYLLSKGIYRTKLRPADLPEWYIEGCMYSGQGYICAKGVKHLVYDPNYTFTNHLFKDDYLFISYDQEITPVKTDLGTSWFEGYDHMLRGWMLVHFIEAVKKYSDFDTTAIEQEIERKKAWYIANNPPEERYEL